MDQQIMDQQVMIEDNRQQQGMPWARILRLVILVAIVIFLILLIKDYFMTEQVEVGIASPTEGAIPPVTIARQ